MPPPPLHETHPEGESLKGESLKGESLSPPKGSPPGALPPGPPVENLDENPESDLVDESDDPAVVTEAVTELRSLQGWLGMLAGEDLKRKVSKHLLDLARPIRNTDAGRVRHQIKALLRLQLVYARWSTPAGWFEEELAAAEALKPAVLDALVESRLIARGPRNGAADPVPLADPELAAEAELVKSCRHNDALIEKKAAIGWRAQQRGQTVTVEQATAMRIIRKRALAQNLDPEEVFANLVPSRR